MSEAEEKILEGDEVIGVEKISEAEDGTVKRTLAYIDRIEEVEKGEDKAVLYIGEETDSMIKIVLPISLLPDDAGEGDNVLLTITIDNAEEDAAQMAEE